MLKFLFPDILSPISRPLLFSSVKRLLGVFVSCFLLLRNPKINIRLKCIRRIREHLDYRRNSQKEGLQSAFKSLRRGANRLVYVREFSRLRRLKRWREIFFVLVRDIGHKTARDKLVLLVHRATSRICKRIAVFFVWMIATKRNGINALHRFTFALHSNDVFDGV